MHRWLIYATPNHERFIPYYKLHVYHAEVISVQSIDEAFADIDDKAREDSVTYIIAPVVLYRNFTQRVIELFRNDWAHAYDFTETIGVDAFRDGRRSRKVKASIPWVVEWFDERWKGAGYVPKGEQLGKLCAAMSEYRVFPLTAWKKTSDCEHDGYP